VCLCVGVGVCGMWGVGGVGGGGAGGQVWSDKKRSFANRAQYLYN